MEELLLKLLEGQAKTDKKLDNIQSDIGIMKEDIAGLKSDISVIRSDIFVMKSDIKSLKSTVARIQAKQEETMIPMLRHIKKQVDKKDRKYML